VGRLPIPRDSATPLLSQLCRSFLLQVVGVGAPNVLGGFTRFNLMGLEEKTGPYHLQKAGYRTGLVGKCECAGRLHGLIYYLPATACIISPKPCSLGLCWTRI
jgi:hypothetical protein